MWGHAQEMLTPAPDLGLATEDLCTAFAASPTTGTSPEPRFSRLDLSARARKAWASGDAVDARFADTASPRSSVPGPPTYAIETGKSKPSMRSGCFEICSGQPPERTWMTASFVGSPKTYGETSRAIGARSGPPTSPDWYWDACRGSALAHGSCTGNALPDLRTRTKARRPPAWSKSGGHGMGRSCDWTNECLNRSTARNCLLPWSLLLIAPSQRTRWQTSWTKWHRLCEELRGRSRPRGSERG